MKLKPGWSEALLHRALARKGRRAYAGAIEDLTAVVAAPDSPLRARFVLAEVKRLDNKPEEAKLDFAAAMKTPPKDEIDWSTRGFARMYTEPAEALKDLDQAIAINPRSRQALVNKSIVLSDLLHRPAEAVATLDQCVAHYPDHTEARLFRAVVLARMAECKRSHRCRVLPAARPQAVLHLPGGRRVCTNQPLRTEERRQERSPGPPGDRVPERVQRF